MSDNNSILSFSDCPNRCVDGYYVDPYSHKRMRCKYCADKRKGIVQKGLKLGDNSINSILNLPDSFSGSGSFDVDSVIPDYAVKLMEPDSVKLVSDKLEDLINKVSAGVVSEYSVLFNLGKKAFENNFIYVYMVRAYMNGLCVSPFISAYELYVLRDTDGEKFSEYIKSDVCVISMDAGSSLKEILGVKGLMQLRSHYQRSTIIFTNVWNSTVKDMCSEGGYSRNLATLFSIEYDKKFLEKEQKLEDIGISRKSSELSSKEFSRLLNGNNLTI